MSSPTPLREHDHEIVLAEKGKPVDSAERVEVYFVLSIDVGLPSPKLIARIFAIDAKSCARFDGQGEPSRAKRHSGLKLLRDQRLA